MRNLFRRAFVTFGTGIVARFKAVCSHLDVMLVAIVTAEIGIQA